MDSQQVSGSVGQGEGEASSSEGEAVGAAEVVLLLLRRSQQVLQFPRPGMMLFRSVAS